MFSVKGDKIIITSGDTAVLTYVPNTSRVFTESDKAVFTVRAQDGESLMRMTLQPEADGRVQIPFVHETTKNWKPGIHDWQIRYYIGAEMAGSTITGVREVGTPMEVGVVEVLRAL